MEIYLHCVCCRNFKHGRTTNGGVSGVGVAAAGGGGGGVAAAAAAAGGGGRIDGGSERLLTAMLCLYFCFFSPRHNIFIHG